MRTRRLVSRATPSYARLFRPEIPTETIYRSAVIAAQSALAASTALTDVRAVAISANGSLVATTDVGGGNRAVIIAGAGTLAALANLTDTRAALIAGQSALAAAYSYSAGAASRTFINTFNDETDATSYTVSGASLSTAGATRAIVVKVMGRVPSGNPVAPTSVTVGGISASVAVSKQTAGDRNSASIWIVAVPTGTTGNIVVDFGGVTQQRCGIVWYATYNLTSLTPVATNSSDVSGAAIGINTQAGGLAFGVGDSGGASGGFTWTGLTEDSDFAVGSGNGWMTTASLETASASTPLAITCTAATASNDMYCTASWR